VAVPRDDERIGDAERERAQQALGVHFTAGRLTTDEFGDRSAEIAVARTRGELAKLFTDLPQPGFEEPPAPPATATRASTLAGTDPRELRGRSRRGRRNVEPMGGRLGAAVVAASPLIALGLFLLIHIWWVFLLIPLASAIVYADSGRRR
jgi:hypothetical protein